MATILEEKTKEYPNSKIEINADLEGLIETVKIDDKFYGFSTDGVISLEYGGDEEFVAKNILRLFNLHIYEENVKQSFEEFCNKIINEEKKLNLNCGMRRQLSVFEIFEKKPMHEKLEENIKFVRDDNLRGKVYEDVFYKNTSDPVK